MEISDKLLEKYNVPVPRYTSYPPANHFNDTFSDKDYLHLLKESNTGKPENIALYFHIPFCKKICHYCGCNACPIGKGDSVAPYMNALRKEIEMVSAFIDKTRPVSQIHYGGGTPNSLDISYIRELNEYLFSSFTFIENPEIAIECNPAYLDFRYVDNLIASGFNRFSLGIQDFDNDILKQVNRLPSAIPAAELFGYLKKNGENLSVNFDFIFGLPGQTVTSFSKTISEAIEIRPDRLVTFSYAHVPWFKKHQIILEKKGLPAPEKKMQMFITGYNMLKTAGYQPIGLDHFVLPEDDLYLAVNQGNLHRNFQGYCTRQTTGQVYAFGVTAISQLEKGYSQNKKDLDEYISDVDKGMLPVERGYILSGEQIFAREIITELMCNKKISFSKIARVHNLSVTEFKNSIKFDETTLNGFAEDGLINYSTDMIEVTEKGTLFIRNIAASLDKEYLEKVKTYSKPV
jgi:oxygen-independent coproporphyrinogen-3 oxidase